MRTDEDTVALIGRLARYYPDAVIAGILNRQQRTTATGLPFTVHRIASQRTHWGIACFTPPALPPVVEPVTIREAAAILGVAPSTLHRQLDDGLIAGARLTPGRAVAHPHHRCAPRALRRRGPGGLRAHRRSHASARGIAPDGVAACQAR
ncbi:helix-turn-helix domain-containing protein [Thiorhodococcus minor]|uniref:helix-turn-helix domain-containing protein n=1 Tax=Thiorhodococcus minor TaxID=57489 RepID=UPI0013DA5BA4|nr:helix-turn-helix domain-containing protein [Thiorhodococcus minor]